jgi:hypothetical protein
VRLGIGCALRPTVGRFITARTALVVLGLVLLVGWAHWWQANLRKNRLARPDSVWFGAYHFLGLDFLNNYHAARHWLAGGNPYREPFGDPLGRRLCYPPVVVPLFAWCGLVEPRAAVMVWMAALAGVAGVAAWACCRTRRVLRLWDMPLSLAVAAVLWSSPVIYAMERGNYDLLVLPLILAAVAALRDRSVVRDLAAGCCLGLAAWIKVYPIVLVPALLPLGRPRALLIGLTAMLAIGLIDYRDLPRWADNVQDLVSKGDPRLRGHIAACEHSLSGDWQMAWAGTPLARLQRVPGTAAALTLVLPLMAWVSYRVYRCRACAELAYPYLLWLAGAATFLPQIANDYNLFYLPLVALAVWDRRDPVFVHLGMALLLLWCQPFAVAIGPRLLLGFKVGSLVCLAAALVNRCGEVGQKSEPRPQPASPALAPA